MSLNHHFHVFLNFHQNKSRAFDDYAHPGSPRAGASSNEFSSILYLKIKFYWTRTLNFNVFTVFYVSKNNILTKLLICFALINK